MVRYWRDKTTDWYSWNGENLRFKNRKKSKLIIQLQIGTGKQNYSLADCFCWLVFFEFLVANIVIGTI